MVIVKLGCKTSMDSQKMGSGKKVRT